MSNLSIYYWIKNNQRGATRLRKTIDTRTYKTYYYALVNVNGVERMTRITKYEYDTINDRHGARRDAFITHTRKHMTLHEHCIQF